jgi:hypothetical protein
MSENENYAALERVLRLAYEQSASGKGKERHAPEGKPFTSQPILEIGRMVGIGFNAGQAMKKLQEMSRMSARGEHDRAKTEVLGAIVYCASVYLLLEELEAAAIAGGIADAERALARTKLKPHEDIGDDRFGLQEAAANRYKENREALRAQKILADRMVEEELRDKATARQDFADAIGGRRLRRFALGDRVVPNWTTMTPQRGTIVETEFGIGYVIVKWDNGSRIRTREDHLSLLTNEKPGHSSTGTDLL